MSAFLSGPGFLGTYALLYADLSLTLTVLAMLLFTAGWVLARTKKFKAHKWIITSAVLLNLTAVIMMIVVFIRNYLPLIASGNAGSADAQALVHGITGLISVLLGIYVVLGAFKILPSKIRFKKYKWIMRTAYFLYLLSTISGILLYIRLYTGA